MTYDCTGWVDSYAQGDINGTLIQQNDKRVFVVVGSLAITPTTADHVPLGGSTYSIINVSRDPAGACWVLQCRV